MRTRTIDLVGLSLGMAALACSDDGNATNLSALGYTNLEVYLNELAGDLD